MSGLRVELRGIAKRYSGVAALQDVSVSIAGGEIHALVGENGAGKSTLGRIIGGAVSPDEGEILIDGRPVRLRSPRDAIEAGVALIDQELALAPEMSVLDNVFLGFERHHAGWLDRAAQRARYEQLAHRLGLEVSPRTRVGELRMADQQKVEVLRAMVRGARLIVMDEPTAALSRVEAQRLLQVARDVRAEGTTIVFVSHFLADVLAISDTITVLKDGRHIKTVPAEGQTEDLLVTSMLGRPLDKLFPEPRLKTREAPFVLEVRGLTRRPAFEDVSFGVRSGEIVGVAGLVGSGRSEVAHAVFGADRPDSGEILIGGTRVRPRSPRDMVRAGVALLPESRKEQGLVMLRSVLDNVMLAHSDAASTVGVLRPGAQREAARRVLSGVDVRMASTSLPVSALSGGNQQKVALAKWLVAQPRLLIADEPTRGVDVGARRAIYDLLVDLADRGVGVLVISSELDEVLGLAHRVLVMRAGRLVAEYPRARAEEAVVMRAAFGGTAGEGTEAGPPASHEGSHAYAEHV